MSEVADPTIADWTGSRRPHQAAAKKFSDGFDDLLMTSHRKGLAM
jgi:hypothetical protein